MNQETSQERAAAGKRRGGPDGCSHVQETSYQTDQHQRPENWDHREHTQRYDLIINSPTLDSIILKAENRKKNLHFTYLFNLSPTCLQDFKKCWKITRLWAASILSGLWSSITPNCTCSTPANSGPSLSKHTAHFTCFSLLLFGSFHSFFFCLLQPGAVLPNTDLWLWELWCTKTICK